MVVLVGSSIVQWRRTQRIQDRDFADPLGQIGLTETARRGNSDHRATDWRGQVQSRGVRVRLLERPGAQNVLVWIRSRMPATLPDGMALQKPFPGLGSLRCRAVRGGYRLQCMGRNARMLMGDVELGLPALEHEGTFSVHAQMRDGWLELGSASCPWDRVAELILDVTGLVGSLQDAADAHWFAAAEELGLQVQSHDPAGHRSLSGWLDGVLVDASVQDGRTVVEVPLDEPMGPMSITHRDLGRAAPVGNPVVDLLVSCHGPPEAFAVLLADDALVEALLSVVHQRKGSELSGRGVVLREETLVRDELVASIRAAVALASAVQRVAAKAE